jgi:hypothetical protein
MNPLASIPIAPRPRARTHAAAPAKRSSGGGGSHASSTSAAARSSSGSKASSSGSSKPVNTIAAAQARADAKERKAQGKAARKYIDQATTLNQQVRALQAALGGKGFIKALNQRLRNVTLVANQQDAALVHDFRSRYGALKDTFTDNEKAAGAQTFAALGNRGRERANALSEAMAQGAGESDMLRTQQMSLRNWNANQNEVSRSYHDTLTSINSSLVDLTADTRTARINMASQANADRSSLWTDYYSQRSETLTQLGNVRGQQAEFYGLANEAVSSKATQGKRKAAAGASGAAFMGATKASATAWKNPGVKASLRNWAGPAAFEGDLTTSNRHETVDEVPLKRPEGATLRGWA